MSILLIKRLEECRLYHRASPQFSIHFKTGFSEPILAFYSSVTLCTLYRYSHCGRKSSSPYPLVSTCMCFMWDLENLIRAWTLSWCTSLMDNQLLKGSFQNCALVLITANSSSGIKKSGLHDPLGNRIHCNCNGLQTTVALT